MNSEQYFDNAANRWDAMQASFFNEVVRERAIAFADVQSGKLAADLGSGTGFITEALLRKGLKVVAIDRSQAMISQMQEKFPGNDAITYRLGSAENAPLADASVDYVFANMFLHHADRPMVAVREMARILKPGGTLVIADLDEHQHDFLMIEHHDRWLGFRRDLVKRWLADAGLINVMIASVGESCCTQATTSGSSASISVFVASGKKSKP